MSQAYWIGPYFVMVWQFAMLSGAVSWGATEEGAGMAVLNERTTASAVEQKLLVPVLLTTMGLALAA
jgi:hypothetical protein